MQRFYAFLILAAVAVCPAVLHADHLQFSNVSINDIELENTEGFTDPVFSTEGTPITVEFRITVTRVEDSGSGSPLVATFSSLSGDLATPLTFVSEELLPVGSSMEGDSVEVVFQRTFDGVGDFVGQVEFDLTESDEDYVVPATGQVSDTRTFNFGVHNGSDVILFLNQAQNVPQTGSEAFGFARLTPGHDAAGAPRLGYVIQFYGIDLGTNPAVPVTEHNPQTPQVEDDCRGVHVHFGTSGNNGPHRLNIFGLAGPALFGNPGGGPRQDDADLVIDVENSTLSGVWDDSDEVFTGPGMSQLPFDSVGLTAALAELAQGALFFEVHTEGIIEGAIRGQLPAMELPGYFLRGDCDGDGEANPLTDAVFQLNYSFVSGQEPPCLASCDANGDGDIGGLLDGVYVLNWGFLDGPAPVAPFPACGDGTLSMDSTLGCAQPPVDCP